MRIIEHASLQDMINAMNDFLVKAVSSQEVPALANSIVGMSSDPIASIYDWCRKNITYTPDPEGDESLTSPVKYARDYAAGTPLKGDCDDIALMVVALCRCAGIQSHVVIIDQKGQGYDHAIAECMSDKLGRWIFVDASSGKVPLGWDIAYVNRMDVI